MSAISGTNELRHLHLACDVLRIGIERAIDLSQRPVRLLYTARDHTQLLL